MDRGPDGERAETVAVTFENRNDAHLPKPREHFLLGQHHLEQFQIFLHDLLVFGEDDQHQTGFVDQRILFHFAKILDDRGSPLCAVTTMTYSAFPKLISGLHFEPEGLGWIGLFHRIEQTRGGMIAFQGF